MSHDEFPMIVNELAESGFQRKAAEGDGPRTSGFHHECPEAARVSPDVRFRIEAAPGEAPSRSISQSKVPVAASVPTESKFQTEEISKVSIVYSLCGVAAQKKDSRKFKRQSESTCSEYRSEASLRETRPGLHSGTQQPEETSTATKAKVQSRLMKKHTCKRGRRLAE